MAKRQRGVKPAFWREMKSPFRIILFLLLAAPLGFALGLFARAFAEDGGPALREIRNINREWRFLLGDKEGAQAPGFDDSTWLPTGLPHSFSVPYFRSKDFYVGYGWYRKTLEIPEGWLSKSVFLEFDGVFQEAEIFVNGRKAGGHQGGYTGFSIDITKSICSGSNVVAVRVNNLWNARLAPRAGEHVFSGGIYRNVRLVMTDSLHVPWYGMQVTTPQVSAQSATVAVKTEIVNASQQAKSCTLNTAVIDPGGKPVVTFEKTMQIAAGATAVFEQTSQPIPNPKLWHPDHSYLYSVRTTVLDSGKPVDTFVSPFGFRWFEWTADRGFFLNGEHYYFCGANVHQDHAGWGDAVTDAGAWRDVKLVKEAGFNFIRGSHYPHSPAFSNACDAIGLLFWSENCFWGTGGFGKEGYWDSSAYPVREEDEKPFEESVRASLRDMIRIHRNHPSIVVWSMSNEPFFSNPNAMPKVRKFLKELVAYSHELDPTRPAAIGGAQRGEIHKLGDIAGLNGDGARLPKYLNPGVASVVSEYGSNMSGRPGDYTPGWGELPTASGQDKGAAYPWRYPWRSGEAIWCAFDHGSIAGSKFGGMGLLDYFRLPKRQWYWYRNEYRKIPPPVWPADGTPSALNLTADKMTLSGDGTDDAQIIISVADGQGRQLRNCVPVTLAIDSGPGEYPTGRSITFEPNSDIDIRDGKAAIEFRSYHAGKTVIRATSPGLKATTIQLVTQEAPSYIEGKTLRAVPRPYVRYKKHGNQEGSLVQFGRENPTRASSEAPDHAACLANDGNPETYWQSAGDQSVAWWQVDLERIVSMAQIALRFQSTNWKSCRVEVSDDGKSWKLTGEKCPSDGSNQMEFSAMGNSGRFLRITFNGISRNHFATISEIAIPGTLTLK